MIRVTLFITFFIIGLPFARADLSKGEIAELKTLSFQIFSGFSPKEFCYVGVGSSPTALIALFQSLGVPALNFPFSRSSVPERVTNIGPTHLIGKRILKHFTHFTPNPKDPHSVCYEKKILYIDFVLSGKSLNLFEKSLNYTNQYHPSLVTSPPYLLALTSRGTTATPTTFHYQLELDYFLTKQMSGSLLDDFREYPQWSSFYEEDISQPLPAYHSFKDELKKQIDSDPKYKKRISKIIETGDVKFTFCEKLLYIIGY